MYYIEYKLGDNVMRKFLGTTAILERFVLDNPQYEYIRVIDIIEDDDVKRKVMANERGKKRKRTNGKPLS